MATSNNQPRTAETFTVIAIIIGIGVALFGVGMLSGILLYYATGC